MRIVAAQCDQVMTGLELSGEVHVPLELVVVAPPRLRERSVRDEFAIKIEPAFIKDAWEKQARFP